MKAPLARVASADVAASGKRFQHFGKNWFVFFFGLSRFDGYDHAGKFGRSRDFQVYLVA